MSKAATISTPASRAPQLLPPAPQNMSIARTLAIADLRLSGVARASGSISSRAVHPLRADAHLRSSSACSTAFLCSNRYTRNRSATRSILAIGPNTRRFIPGTAKSAGKMPSEHLENPLLANGSLAGQLDLGPKSDVKGLPKTGSEVQSPRSKVEYVRT